MLLYIKFKNLTGAGVA